MKTKTVTIIIGLIIIAAGAVLGTPIIQKNIMMDKKAIIQTALTENNFTSAIKFSNKFLSEYKGNGNYVSDLEEVEILLTSSMDGLRSEAEGEFKFFLEEKAKLPDYKDKDYFWDLYVAFENKYRPYESFLGDLLDKIDSEDEDVRVLYEKGKEEYVNRLYDQFKEKVQSVNNKIDSINSGRIWLTSKKKGTLGAAPGIMPYIGFVNKRVYLRMAISYYKYSQSYHSWIFVESFTINVDGMTYRINPDYSDIDRDNGTNWIREKLDTIPTEDEIIMLKRLGNGNSVTIAYNGDDYFEYKLTQEDMNEIHYIMNVYDELIKYPEFGTKLYMELVK